ncbi:hypothetical protein [Halalkalibacter krulwichiae]|uniref:Uncharacterized protein n=1 Tax=Halalkalibacter krulwichiae TaxID=199441 RepID=A0A1X9MHS0_9BACI|nr:hypothetical protein [Halalkalibacter krulwichiae]ARK32214.1 hypothetical protein BkAM31D_21475 [Halalkalibacter krulwichiae]
MSVTENNSNNPSAEAREVVLRLDNLGVAFNAQQKDDYKSHVINLFKKRKKIKSKRIKFFGLYEI